MSYDHTIVSRLVSLSQKCSSMHELKRIHARLLVHNLSSNILIAAKLLRFAAISPAGDLDYAHALFSHLLHPTTFFYNTLIRGYAKTHTPSQSISLFRDMRRKSTPPDEFTFNFLLKASAQMQTPVPGEEVHGQVFKFGFCRHVHVNNSLINFYAANGSTLMARRVFDGMLVPDVVSWSGLVVAHVKARELDYARQVFDEMPERDGVSWTALISGYAREGRSAEALVLFWKMQEAGVQPDEVTMLGVISACANLRDLEAGMSVHQYVEENGFTWMVPLCNALINMYSKCGCVEKSREVFERMPRRSLISWNCIILAYAVRGMGAEAIGLFREMREEAGLRPDGATFLAVMSACAHKGWIEDGARFFESMEGDYGIAATVEHYGCMVDLLGRAGRLDEAYGLIMSTPVARNSDEVWRVLLGACKIHGHADMGKRVANKLLELSLDEGDCCCESAFV